MGGKITVFDRGEEMTFGSSYRDAGKNQGSTEIGIPLYQEPMGDWLLTVLNSMGITDGAANVCAVFLSVITPHFLNRQRNFEVSK